MKTMQGNITNTETSLASAIGTTICIHGSIYKIRRMSGFAFVLLRTRQEVVQCLYDPAQASFSLDTLQEEMCVRFSAYVAEEPRSRTGYELHLLTMEILSSPAALPEVAINNRKINTSLENLLNLRPLTLRNEKERAIFKIQEGLVYGIREFLASQNFTEIHTPKIVANGAEGGANIFRLDYFGQEAYLAQSPQFYKQIMVGVFERVYEIGPVFRAEKHDTSRHLNEYTSVDFEMGFIHSFHEIMEMETAMLRHAFAYLSTHYTKELSLLQVSLPVIDSIPAIPFLEAKELIASQYNRHITDWNDFDPEEEKLLSSYILETTGSDFVFVTAYPSTKRPFYAMDDPVNPSVTLSFDLLFRGLEITTGGQRIHDYQQQIAKMESRGMDTEPFASYLQAHKYGLPPHGGMGLGLERLTSRLLNLPNTRLATLFPRDTKRLMP